VRNPTTRRLFGAAALLGLAALALPTDAADPIAGADKVLTSDAKFLEKGLEKSPPEKRAIPTLKAVAMMIALNAQNQAGGKDAALKAGERDAALAVAAALAAKDYPAAKEAAAKISAPLPAKDAKPVDLAKMHKFDLAEVMSTFRKARVGGLGLEDDVRAFSKGVKDPEAAALAGGRIALIGHYTLALPPDINNPAQKAQWEKWSKEMTKLGEEAAAEGAKGATADNAKLATTFKNLDINCNACHTAFRN
jgi:hypothetical protein